MLSKLLLWSVAVIGLLAGVQKVSADQLFYCKNPNITNQPLALYTATPTCPSGTTVTGINVSGPPGTALGASQFSCVRAFLSIPNGAPISGSAGYTRGVSFGSGVTYTSPGSTFVLQPGIYQVQLIIPSLALVFPGQSGGFQSAGVNVLVNNIVVDSPEGTGPVGAGGTAGFSVIGDTLLQISASNSVVAFNVSFQFASTVDLSGCRIVFTQLQ